MGPDRVRQVPSQRLPRNRVAAASGRFLAALGSPLGRVDGVSVVRYLDNRVFFAGSFAGPSHLVRIAANRLEFLLSFANSGPIIDMVPVAGETPEEIRFVGAGGYDETAAMLEIRSGVECHVISDETPELAGKQLPLYMGTFPRGSRSLCGFLRRPFPLLRSFAGIVSFWREFHSSVKPSIPAESSEVVLLQDTVAGVSLTVCERFIRVGETEIPMEHSISFAAASGRFFLVADRREIRVFSVSGETPSVCVSITAGRTSVHWRWRRTVKRPWWRWESGGRTGCGFTAGIGG